MLRSEQRPETAFWRGGSKQRPETAFWKAGKCGLIPRLVIVFSGVGGFGNFKGF